MHISILFFSVA